LVDISEKPRTYAGAIRGPLAHINVLENISDGIVLFDEDLNYTYINQRGSELLAREPGDLIGKNYWQEYPEARGTPFAEAYARAVETHAVTVFEDFYEPWQRWFENRIYPAADGIMVLFTEITERKKQEAERGALEQQLRQAQKMEAIGRLAGGVAHDFNNMLMIIQGHADVMLEELSEGDEMRADLLEISEAARRSAELTRQLLAFSRKQTLQPQVMDANRLMRGLDKMLRRLIGEDIDLKLVLAEDLHRVKVDPGQIEQVVMNLVINARDAMADGGKLTLETANVELDAQYAARHSGHVIPGEYVMIAVSDDGCGMDAETRAKIFDPFFTTKERGKGTGLGLSTVHGIVNQSGGHIRVYSELTHGTTFRIYFPRIHEDLPEQVAPAFTPRHVVGDVHVLVVEDEQALRSLMAQSLERVGYRVTAASQGAEALELVEGRGLRPDLVVTDVVMPGINGAVLARRLRETLPDVPVLYVSGYTDNAIAHRGVLDPGTPFLHKPFTLAALALKVASLLPQG